MKEDYYSDDDDACEYDEAYYEEGKENLFRKAVAADDLPKFVAKMQQCYDFDREYEEEEPYICPRLVLSWICDYGALTCATELLQGQSYVYVDLNIPLACGRYPLHQVASRLNYDLVDLFLSQGARTDVRKTKTERRNSLPFNKAQKSLPLNEAVEALRLHLYLFDWTPEEESIYKLIIILCLPQMKVALETIRLLALSSTKEDIIEVFNNYAKQGMLIEMAVLLMVANEQIFTTPTNKDGVTVDGGGGIMGSIRDIMGNILLLQANEESRVYVCNNGEEERSKVANMCEIRRTLLMYTLMVLNLFDRAGDAIRSYIRSRNIHVPKDEVVKSVVSILTGAGFVLEDKDIDLSTIDCESDKIKEASGTSENIAAYKSHDYLGMFLNPSHDKFHTTKKAPRVWPPNLQIYQPTVFNWYSSSSSDRHVGHCLRRFSSSASFDPQHNRYKGEKINAMQQRMLHFKSNNLLASLALSFRRGMRRL